MEILVVEDDQSTREVYAHVFAALNYRAHIVPDNCAAAPIVHSLPIKAAVLDYWIGANLTCAPTAELLRAHGVPYMVMTAWHQPDRLADIVYANDWLRKPFDIDELDIKLQTLLSKFPVAPPSLAV